MADTNETIADIIAWLRRPIEGENAYLTLWRDEIADRLDAAHKRERGNFAALREALKAISGLCDRLMPTWDGAVGRIKDIAETALAAPATSEKSSAVGNAAKLREALKLCLRGMCGYCRMDAEARGMTTECVNGCEALLMAKAALAAPPRNCDVYTSDELKVKFNSELDSELPIANEHEKNLIAITAMGVIDTLFAPATEQEGGGR